MPIDQDDGLEGRRLAGGEGLVAEDDTIFVATDNVFDTRLLIQRLRRIIKA
jgi:hypothetical protein